MSARTPGHTMVRAFLGLWSLVLSVSAGPAWAEEDPGFFVNRSLVTVGNDVYTALDGRLLLVLWNALAEPTVPLTTDFGASIPRGEVSGDQSPSVGRVLRTPPDARRLLFILFVWDESKRLNLFAPTTKSLSDAQVALQFSEFFSKAPEDVLAYWKELSEQAKVAYLDVVLRAKAYLSIRGDLETNTRLMDAFWFWHTVSEGL